MLAMWTGDCLKAVRPYNLPALVKGKMFRMLLSLLTLVSLFRWSCLAAKGLWRWMRWKICPNWSKCTHTLTHENVFVLTLNLFVCSFREVCESSVLLNLKKRFQRDCIYVSLDNYESEYTHFSPQNQCRE